MDTRKAEKKKLILDAAVKVFARRGFYNARISEIASNAGVADGTIYNYFKNKDDLLISIFDESISEIINRFRKEIAGTLDPAEQIRTFALLHFQIVENQPDLAKVLQLELRQSNHFIKEYAGTSLNDYLNLIGEIIQRGQAMRIFRDDIQPGIAKRIIFGALDEMATLWLLSREKKYDLQTCADHIAKIFLQGMLAPAVETAKSIHLSR